ncbi:integrase catalytic domain-containing protein [Trichonephila clavipes]|nr:integrase catalytic domain-containing protein [Trichonephila clavipes]
MEPKSKAERLVLSFPATAENNPKAIDQLKERFGREDLLVQIYVRELLNLVMKNAVSGRTKTDLSALYDELEGKLRSLESLGRTQEKYGDFLTPLVESCLPEEILMAWERKRNTETDAKGSRTLEHLMTFLRLEVQGEEMVQLDLSLRRFIARRGRPRIIYCDNGTNFRGAFNDLAKLDWHKISRETSTQKIVWKFIPPTAAWWGGWWERLVRIIKELLRRSLGKSILSYEELSTVICECEFLINSRPLTYISENPQELIPLTPAMFLIENRCSDTTDIDELNSTDLRKRMKYRIKLLSDLRQRFRKEYLSELIQKQNDNRVREPRIGEMVLIGNDNKKRLSWPIAKIIELIPGRDGEIRTVRLKTQHGTVIRPVQRIFPLEVQAIANSDKELKEESVSVKSTKPEKVLNINDAIIKKYTSSGRLVKEPKRLDLLNYNCYRFETLPKSQRGEYVVNGNDLCE